MLSPRETYTHTKHRARQTCYVSASPPFHSVPDAARGSVFATAHASNMCAHPLLRIYSPSRPFRQFVDHITGKHVGFPESELTTLFQFFRSPTEGGGARASSSRPSSRRSRNNIARKGGDAGGGGGGGESSPAQGADWTVAVACLRLLARPKEPVMASALAVFEVFARARGDRARHARRLEQERLEGERQRQLEEERERWKRRRRREQERGIVPSSEVGQGVRLFETDCI